MLVKDLIEQLKKLDPTSTVVIQPLRADWDVEAHDVYIVEDLYTAAVENEDDSEWAKGQIARMTADDDAPLELLSVIRKRDLATLFEQDVLKSGYEILAGRQFLPNDQIKIVLEGLTERQQMSLRYLLHDKGWEPTSFRMEGITQYPDAPESAITELFWNIGEFNR